MTKVLLHNSRTDHLRSWLQEAGLAVEVATCEAHEAMAATLEDFKPDVVFSIRFAGNGYPTKALLGPHGPRWLANGGSGTNHLGTWDTNRVTVTNTAGVAADMMAEYILGGFLHFTLDVPGLQADQAARRWDAGRLVRPLSGKMLLIVGLGHTGRSLALRAQAFGMQVWGTRARVQATEHVDAVFAADDLLEALPRADFVAVATPLLPSTRGLLGQAAFAAMKPGVVIADVSRGGVIEHGALLAALADGRVAGAALDVFETEPLPETSPLWDQPNVLISPHCSSVHADWEQASFGVFLDNLRRWQAGEPLENVVDPVRGY